MTKIDSTLRTYVLLCAVGFLAFLSYDLIRSPLLPLFAEHLGATPAIVGFVVAASTLTGVCLKLPAGVLSDRLGRRLFLFVGVLVFALAPLLYFLVTAIWQLVALRFVHGLATAIFTPVALAIIADLFPTRRGEMIGWYSALRQSGTLIGRMGGGALIDIAGFTAVFATCGGIGVMIVGLFYFSSIWRWREVQTRHARVSWQQLWSGLVDITRHPKIVTTSVMQGILMLADGMLMAFLPIYAVNHLGLTPTEVGLLFGVQGIVTIVSRPVMGRKSDIVGRSPMIIVGLLTCAAAFALLPVTQTFLTLFVPACLFGIGSAIVASATSAYVADLTRAESMGSAMGVFGMFMDVGHASGPLFGGILVTWFGYRPAFWMIAALIVVGLVSFRYVDRRRD